MGEYLYFAAYLNNSDLKEMDRTSFKMFVVPVGVEVYQGMCTWQCFMATVHQ